MPPAHDAAAGEIGSIASQAIALHQIELETRRSSKQYSAVCIRASRHIGRSSAAEQELAQPNQTVEQTLAACREAPAQEAFAFRSERAAWG